MRLEWLEDMLAVLDTGSLNAAAQKRFVTQPAFSRRIMAIEAHLGVELLDRARKPAQMKAGVRNQRERLQELAAGLRDLENDLRRQDRAVQNHIVLSSQHALTTSVAPGLVKALSADPSLNIRLRSANRDECYAQLLTRQAEIALLYESATEPLPVGGEYLESLVIGPEMLVPVFPTPHLSRLNEDYARGEISIVAYPSEVFLGKVFNQEIAARFPNASFLRKRAETALTLAMKQLVMDGVGVGWLPKSLVEEDLAAGRLSDLGNVLPRTRLTIVALRLTGARSTAVNRVWEALRESARKAVEESSPEGI
ncbi:LysR family transcriptional regulator [Jiella marina]|uniref:LysR family transcriptional regulator n=1 Tax=Jiella sp. LLJ827 TaxID=2917712 RepID=UPI002100DD42|nr:LysR substrate-binding domain-containing protein [Jiella sp. LLJ827]MCQ0988740.1 LysR substrate-binding domain-containing protein [Jiella sp. LLJ827]